MVYQWFWEKLELVLFVGQSLSDFLLEARHLAMCVSDVYNPGVAGGRGGQPSYTQVSSGIFAFM